MSNGNVKGSEFYLKDMNLPWRKILHLACRCTLTKSSVLPTGGGFYYIEKGKVRLGFMGYSGRELGALILGRGCLFNEIPALVSPHYLVGFTVLEIVHAWRFDVSLLHDESFISTYPQQVSNLLCSLARKSGIFFFKMSGSRKRSSLNRLCAFLLHLAENNKDELTMSQTEVSDMLGMHQTTIARCVRLLRERGIIGRFTKNKLEILDMDALRILALDEQRSLSTVVSGFNHGENS